MTDEQIELKRQVARWEEAAKREGEPSVEWSVELVVAITLANRLIVALDRIECLEGERRK